MRLLNIAPGESEGYNDGYEKLGKLTSAALDKRAARHGLDTEALIDFYKLGYHAGYRKGEDDKRYRRPRQRTPSSSPNPSSTPTKSAAMRVAYRP